MDDGAHLRDSDEFVNDIINMRLDLNQMQRNSHKKIPSLEFQQPSLIEVEKDI